MPEPTITVTPDDIERLGEIAGELEHLPAEFRRHFDQDGRDARFLRILQERFRDTLRAALTSPQPESYTREQVEAKLQPVVERLERIRDLDEQTSDGALGSLARHALDELSAAFPDKQGGEQESVSADEVRGILRGRKSLNEAQRDVLAALRDLAIKHRRKEQEVRDAETADRESGKLAADSSYEATWNYHQGLWKAYEHAADQLRRALPQQQSTEEAPAGRSERPDEGEACKRCGSGNTVWGASSPLWNAVMRGGSIDGDPIWGDMVCATCFMQLAEEAGIASAFHVVADQVNVELETTTPSGRVWDEKQRLWVAPNPTEEGEHD